MRTIERSSAFRRDFKRAKANPRHARDVDASLLAAIKLLATDRPLPESNRDHPLSGDWAGYRECHLKPDLLLVYRKSGDGILKLARLGSHSELFG
jgi:mRNA interferase YafQ